MKPDAPYSVTHVVLQYKNRGGLGELIQEKEKTGPGHDLRFGQLTSV